MGLHIVLGSRVGGRYLIIDSLLPGASSEVFTAWDEERQTEVVLKFQGPKEGDATFDFVNSGKWFQKEAKLGARLRQIRGLARTIDRGNHDGREYLVIEKVVGISLTEYRLAKIPVRSRYAASVIYQLADTLHAMHEIGFVHRDVKTENALIQWDGRVRLIDLGLAARINLAPRRWHSIGATAGYRAPEAYDGLGMISPVSDIYSLGCILFEMAVMRLPYQHYDGCPADDTEPFLDQRELAQMPDALRTLGLMMIAHSADDRPQSMAEVCVALDPLIPPLGAAPEPDAGLIDPTAPLRHNAALRHLSAR